jgi:hypothetical protein
MSMVVESLNGTIRLFIPLVSSLLQLYLVALARNKNGEKKDGQYDTIEDYYKEQTYRH